MIDTALWHLPGFGTIVDTTSGEQHVPVVHQKDADAGPIRTVLIGSLPHEEDLSAPKTATPRMRSRARASW